MPITKIRSKLETKRTTDRKTVYKPVRQSITIHIGPRAGENAQAKLIDACDVYADALAIRKLPKSRDFNITHTPTGLSIIDYVSPKAKAIECVMVLLEDGAEIWRFGEFGGEGVTQANFDRCKRVRDKAKHLAHPENWNEDGTRVR